MGLVSAPIRDFLTMHCYFISCKKFIQICLVRLYLIAASWNSKESIDVNSIYINLQNLKDTK
jgi:hypothetical protein